ncbi:MAG: phosphatidylserine decarboxylase family protein, partial [Woeseiaceae bacterium]
MEGRRNLFVASEGVPFLLAMTILTGAALHFWGAQYAVLPAALIVYLYLIFRDPKREVPAVPLGVVSPADGLIV